VNPSAQEHFVQKQQQTKADSKKAAKKMLHENLMSVKENPYPYFVQFRLKYYTLKRTKYMPTARMGLPKLFTLRSEFDYPKMQNL
jgi:hypothetical protein